MAFSSGVETFRFFAVASIVLFLGMLLLMEGGFRLGIRRGRHLGTVGREGLGSAETAVLGLLGLILAFTFSGAADHRETRQQLIAEEANAIETAYLRLDLLREPDRSALRSLFRQYLDVRLAAYRAMPDIRKAQAGFDEATRLQEQIWSQATTACRAETWTPATLLLLPAINSMIDISGVRTMAMKIHPPTAIYGLLMALALLSALLAGYSMAASPKRSLLHMLILSAFTSLVIFVTVNLEAPRLGVLRVTASDEMLVDLRERMH